MSSNKNNSNSSTSYRPLARRYRPIRFEGVEGIVGQPHVVRTLKNAILTGQIANAYLLAGPRGTGKTTAARVLAAALNCEQREAGGEPCGVCDTCTRIVMGKESSDVIEIDAATNRGADDARQLRQQALYAPSTERAYKVYIVDEAHMLTREAWNALLKILEEPPSRVLFVFCTTEPLKIEQTAQPILSRCQRLDMRRLTLPDIISHLKSVSEREGIAIDEEALVLIARRADGGMRDSLSMLDQLRSFQAGERITTDSVRESFGMQSESVYLNTLDLIATRDRGRVFKLIQYLDDQGTDFVRFLEDLQDTIAALARVQEEGDPEGWSARAVSGFKKRAGYIWENGGWVKKGEPALSTTILIEVLALCQVEARQVRGSSRASTIVLTLLQRSITLADTFTNNNSSSSADGPQAAVLAESAES